MARGNASLMRAASLSDRASMSDGGVEPAMEMTQDTKPRPLHFRKECAFLKISSADARGPVGRLGKEHAAPRRLANPIGVRPTLSKDLSQLCHLAFTFNGSGRRFSLVPHPCRVGAKQSVYFITTSTSRLLSTVHNRKMVSNDSPWLVIASPPRYMPTRTILYKARSEKPATTTGAAM